MNAPDKIFLQACGSCTEEGCKYCKFEDLEDNVTWCKDRIFKKDIAYIRKDALLEWAKARKAELLSCESFVAGERKMLKEIIDKLNSM